MREVEREADARRGWDMAATVREATWTDAEAIGGIVGELGYPSTTGVRAQLGSWLDARSGGC